MNYSAAVSDTWRHYELDDAARKYRGLVRYATLAASSHNTQPWKFKLERGRIVILAERIGVSLQRVAARRARRQHE